MVTISLKFLIHINYSYMDFLLHFTYSHIHALIQALTFYFVMIVLTTVDWQATSHPKKNFMTRLFTVIPPILENSIIAPGTDDFKQDFFYPHRCKYL